MSNLTKAHLLLKKGWLLGEDEKREGSLRVLETLIKPSNLDQSSSHLSSFSWIVFRVYETLVQESIHI